ncbi:MAG: tetratricopeptide repeat protein [Chthoniobacterales bacterium]
MMDVVGYSKLLITEQIQVMGELTRVVKSTRRFRRGEETGQLIRVPAGDGMILVFFDEPEAAIESALEISAALKDQPAISIRMGIHSGPVSRVRDVNEQWNVAGAGVDMAQRVMDCGDAGHILLSKRVADDLSPLPRWNPLLHDLGECEVKHGHRMALVNVYSADIGNSEVPNKSRSKEALSEKDNPSATKSIAVLPFENLSAEPDNAYLAVGIQEEILTQLCKIADLKVISRTSTQRFKTVSVSMRDIADQLGAANVLEGSVQKAGDRIRVHVQLINAATDAHLWGERFDRTLTDIFEVESEIAERVANALKARLSGEEREALFARPTESTEAHQFYLKGLYYWNKFFAPNFEKCRDYFERAIALDPCYALPHAGLAVYYAFCCSNGILPPDGTWPKVETLVNKALALDPTLAETYNPLAAVKLYRDRDWTAAERAFRRGIELNPKFPEVYVHYGLCLFFFGRKEESIRQIDRAIELEPLSARLNVNKARALYFIRDYDRAIDEFKTALELDANYAFAHEWLGYVYETVGKETDAVTEWSKGFILNGQPALAATLESVVNESGFAAAVGILAQQSIARLDARTNAGEYVAAAEYAIAYTRLRDFDPAFACLAKAMAERNRFAYEMTVTPLLDPLRSDARYAAILDAILPRE